MTNIQSIMAQLKDANMEQANLTRQGWGDKNNQFFITVHVLPSTEMDVVKLTAKGTNNFEENWNASFEDLVADDWNMVSLKGAAAIRGINRSIKVPTPFHTLYREGGWWSSKLFPNKHFTVKLIGNKFTIKTAVGRKVVNTFEVTSVELGLGFKDDFIPVDINPVKPTNTFMDKVKSIFRGAA